MTGRRLLLIVVLIFGLTASSTAAPFSIPLIVQISPLSNINTIAGILGATVVDNIPGTSIYLLNVPFVIPSWSTALLGIQWLELNTAVAVPNFPLQGLVTVPPTVAADWYKQQPSWKLIRASNALPYSTGTGVIVADINSRVDQSHPALQGHFTSGYDFVSSKPAGYAVFNQAEYAVLDQAEYAVLDQAEYAVLDQFGALLTPLGLPMLDPAYSHGTLTVGVIAGIAPNSMIMPVRAFDDNGQADIFMLAKAIRWAASNGAHVINMSWGTRTNSKAIKSAIDFARSRDVLLVASAGNDNTSFPQYPAAYSGVMTTAATDLFDKKAGFSNYGSYVFVTAPGMNIFSTYPGGHYSIASGTSFSAPAVAGTAALVRSLRTTGVANSIAAGAVDIDYKNPQYVDKLGYGRIDVLRAVNPN
jgi:subtilisin family serine protease